MWYIVGGRIEGKMMSGVSEDKYGAMMLSYAMVLAGADWVEVYQHEEGSFAMF